MTNSIVDYLTSKGQASDYNSRAKLAQSQGIQNYTGTAEQNTQLLSNLQKPATQSTAYPSLSSQLLKPTATSTQAVNTSTPSSIGVKAIAPTGTAPINTIPSNQVNTTQPLKSPTNTSSAVNQGASVMTPEMQDKYYATQNTANPMSPTAWLAQQNASQGQTGGNASVPTPTPVPAQAPTGYSPTDTGLYGQLVTGLANAGTSPQYLQQMAEANRINQQMEEAKKQMAQQTNDINQSGTWTSRALGEQGQANIQNAATLGALGSQYQGATNQLSAANTQQGLTQQALQQAASLAQPQLGSYGQTYYNPVTGGNTQGGDMTGAMQTYAQNLVNGQMSAIPSAITGNPVLFAQLQAMAKQINPNFNYNVASGMGAAQQTTAGTQSAQVQSMTSALQQGKNLQTQLTDLLTQFGLNPSDINKANAGLQTIANNVSDPKYKILNNYVNDIANTYAQVLTPAGGSATDTTRAIAQSMLDATMKGQGLIAVMQSLDSAAQAKIAGIPTSGGMGTNNNQNANTGTTGSSWDNI